MIPTDNENEVVQQILEKITELTQRTSSTENPLSNKPARKRRLICYACDQENHYARDCPVKAQYLQTKQLELTTPQHQDQHAATVDPRSHIEDQNDTQHFTVRTCT